MNLPDPSDPSLGATLPGPHTAELDATIAVGAMAQPGVQGTLIAQALRATVLPRVQVDVAGPVMMHEPRVRYEEGDMLGRGGVGEVVRAMDNDIHRPVAIKRILPDNESPAVLARFVDEIRVIGQLEHPNIVPIHDVGLDQNGRYYFVMKYVNGETLESILDKLDAGDPHYHAMYTFERRTLLFVGILEAMQYAHARGVIHRDIKPANIMVGPYGEVMVMDWGIAKRMGEAGPDALVPDAPAPRMAGTHVGSVVGTPAYMSPEQARGEIDKLDVRSDIYSLCVLYHELLCLRHYLADCTTLEALLAGVLTRKPMHPSFVHHPHQGRVPADLAWIVLDGLAKDPVERYASVEALLSRIRKRFEGQIRIQCPVTFTKRLTMVWTHLIDGHPMIAVALAMMGVLGFVGSAGFIAWQVVAML